LDVKLQQKTTPNNWSGFEYFKPLSIKISASHLRALQKNQSCALQNQYVLHQPRLLLRVLHHVIRHVQVALP
jgi:hypothetical protein